MAIVVFGSINMDLVARAPRLPVLGETLTGVTFFTSSGGKGANQAVGCALSARPLVSSDVWVTMCSDTRCARDCGLMEVT